MTNLLLIFVTSFMCFLSCSVHQQKGEASLSKSNTLSQNEAPVASQTTSASGNGSIENRAKKANIRVDTYEDGKLVNRHFFLNGELLKLVTYNVELGTEEFEIDYNFSDGGGFESLKVIKGNEPVLSEYFTEEAMNFQLQSRILRSKSVVLPNAEIVPDLVSDISWFLSSPDSYPEVKAETSTHEGRKILKLRHLNKKIGYERSRMIFRSGGIPILVREYRLTMEDQFPTEEYVKTDGGELVRTYVYTGERLTGVSSKFTDLENRTNSLEKRFEYHELN